MSSSTTSLRISWAKQAHRTNNSAHECNARLRRASDLFQASNRQTIGPRVAQRDDSKQTVEHERLSSINNSRVWIRRRFLIWRNSPCPRRWGCVSVRRPKGRFCIQICFALANCLRAFLSAPRNIGNESKSSPCFVRTESNIQQASSFAATGT